MAIRQFVAFLILLSLGTLAFLLIATPEAPSAKSQPPDGTALPIDRMAPAQNGTNTGASAPSPPSIWSSASDDWQIECADCPKQFDSLTGSSLQLDSSGYPHVAYAGDHVYYAWFDGTDWHYETVDESIGARWYPSLALNALGQPHISYFDATNNQLKHAWHDGSSWRIELVDSAVHARETALKLDSWGNATISYCDYTDQLLKLARQDGSGWLIETVDNSDGICTNVSLALDNLDRPHISYCIDSHLKFAGFDGAAWRIDTVDTAGYSRNSLALEARTGRPHISYRNGSQIRYAWRDRTTWHLETVEEWAGQYGRSAALALDPVTGRPHLAFDSGVMESILTVNHAWHNGTGWQTEWVSPTGLGGSEISIALDATGLAHVAFFRSFHAQTSAKHLVHAYRDAGIWQIEELDSSVRVGWNTSLALDGDEQPHISYTDNAGNVRYAFGPPPTTPVPNAYRLRLTNGLDDKGIPAAVANLHDGEAWQLETVVSFGIHPSLALDKEDQPHLSFGGYSPRTHNQRVDDSHHPLAPATAAPPPVHDLEHAWRHGQEWQTERVDASGDTGYHASMALDSSEHLHISYYDSTNADLKFAAYDGAGWQTATVDSTGDVGTYSSLALDREGHAHISYYDATNADLKYATHDGLIWHLETVDSPGDTGHYTSIALDETGQPHISYYDATLDDLKYAYVVSPTVGIKRDSSRWRIETVDSVGGVNTSLALELGTGLPRISHYSEGNLKYAWYDGLKWRIETVDAGPSIGRYSSLALNANTGLPNISYQAGNPWYDLRYASRLLHPFTIEKQADPRDGLRSRDTLTYSLTFVGPGVDARLLDPLPDNVHYVSGTLTGTLTPAPVFSPTARAILWQGILPAGIGQLIRFQVTPTVFTSGSLPLAPPIVNTVWLTDTTNKKTVSATVIVNALQVYLPLLRHNH
jgi:hypothetical protein